VLVVTTTSGKVLMEDLRCV